MRSARLKTVIEGIQGGIGAENSSKENNEGSISEDPKRDVPESRAAKKMKLT